SSLFFFFQAEDGIRDFHVTGVQTCALPISIASGGSAFRPALSLASSAALLEKAFAMDAPAVAISINSPGGSPVQSRLIFKRIREDRKSVVQGKSVDLGGRRLTKQAQRESEA